MEDFKPEDLQECTLAVFLMATYGEGESTDNALTFSKWMHDEAKTVPPTFLHRMNYTVFGLGNRQYEHFNRMGKRTNATLEAFGAKRVFDYGEGDDDGTLDEDFAAWKAKMWPSLVSQFNNAGAAAGDAAAAAGTSQKVQLTYKVVPIATEADKAAAAKASAAQANKISSTNKHFFTAPLAAIAVNRELRTGGGPDAAVGSTRHVEIDLSGTGLTYVTADNLAVMPENDPTMVAELAKALGYTLDQAFYVEPVDAGDHDLKYDFPTPCTVQDALTRFFDIHGAVKHATLTQLLPYVSDPQQQAWLKGLLAEDNRAAFKAFAVESCKSVASLLVNGGELSSCKVPLADFLHIVPFVQPRYYTISSSSSVHPHRVHITVSVTQFKSAQGRAVKGLCSGYLQKLVPGVSAAAPACRVFVRPSTFRLPKQLSTPVVMIGPGTGLAPMRALLQDRQWQGEHQTNGNGNGHGNGHGVPAAGKNTLYFGCQKRSVDFIYRDEMEAYQASGVLSSLQLAFSREQEQKVYVQHLIRAADNAKEMVADLDQGAYVFVCGATNMGTDVMAAVVDVLVEHKGLSKEAAADAVKDLQKQGRYVQELWTP